MSASYRAITVYGHLKIYIEVCGSHVRRVDYVSFLICTDGVHTPGYDPISPEDQLLTLILTPRYPRGSVSDLLTQGVKHEYFALGSVPVLP